MDLPSTSPERLLRDAQWLQRVAQHLVGDVDAAEDLAQDTWIAALRARGTTILNRRAWLRRSLFRQWVDRRRREDARRGREEDVARPEALPSSAELCERAELQRVMGETLLALDEPFRTTALLRFLEGLEPAEIAERLDVPANTVRWRLRRSVERLRERLDRDAGERWGVALLALAESKPAALASAPATVSIGAWIMMKNLWLAVLGLGLLGLLSFLEMRGSDEPTVLRPSGPSSEAPADLVPLPGQGSVAVAEERVALAPGSESRGLPQAVAADAPATIVFEACAREDGRPLAGVAALPEVGGQQLVSYEDSQARLSDSAGRLRYEVPAGVVVHVQAWGEDPPAGLAVLDVSPLDPGEERTVSLELPTAIDIRFFGRLLDEETGEPLRSVKVVPKSPSGLPKAIEHAVSDESGFFELRVPSWRFASFHAATSAHGRIVFAPSKGHASRASALDLTLPPSSSIEGYVDLAGMKKEPVQVAFHANGRDVHRPKPQGSAHYLRESWTAKVGEDGRYRIEGLNSGARYQAELLVGERVVREHSGDLVLDPGETRELDWLLGRGAHIGGELVDQNDEPLADHEVWLVATRWMDERRFGSYEEGEAIKVRTDSWGLFEFEGVPAGDWLIGPGIVSEGPGSDVAPWAVPLVIQPERTRVDVRLSTWRGLAIRGVVLDSKGLPVACPVTLDTPDSNRVSLRSDETGRFEATGLQPTSYTLTAGGMSDGYARSEPVEAEPGAGEVELQLGISAVLQGRVLGEHGLGALGTALVSTRTPPNPEDDWMTVGVRIDGYFTIDGLVPGLYDIFVYRKDGQCRLVTEHRVAPGSSGAELELELEPGAHLSPQVAGAVQRASYELFLDGALVGVGRCSEDRSGSTLVPPGTIEVRYQTDLGTARTVLVPLLAGESRDVDLQ